MNHLPTEWSEAHRRAETYLRVVRGCFGAMERKFLASAVQSARGQLRLDPAAHPLTLVMEALFGFLSAAQAPAAMTPPLQRATMVPELTEFPAHDWLGHFVRRVKRR